jgi:endonuclease G
MRKFRFSILFITLLWLSCSCTAGNSVLSEKFEAGRKASYATGDVQLGKGKWTFEDALIGDSPADKKNGAACARIRNLGSITMQFDVIGPLKDLTIAHATYGSDKDAVWRLQYSENSGKEWKNISPEITATAAMQKASFYLEHKGLIRIRIQKISGGRLNIDDIQTGHSAQEDAVLQVAKPKRDDNMALGNPSGADGKQTDNYLVVKPQFALSYNNSKGISNWVSWHLSREWKGVEPRCNCFAPDGDLPKQFVKVYPSFYISSGFDKGHMCPSDDRNYSREDNAATFAMSNMTPQAPNLNRDVWEKLESYSRKLMSRGNELYIISGAYGKGGMGEKGRRDKIGGKVTVPARLWKVIVILPQGENDPGRINRNTRIIAVDMPNEQSVNIYPWQHYRTSIDAIEKATGYDLLSNIPVKTQAAIEMRIDGGPVR